MHDSCSILWIRHQTPGHESLDPSGSFRLLQGENVKWEQLYHSTPSTLVYDRQHFIDDSIVTSQFLHSIRMSRTWQWLRVIPSPPFLHCLLHLVHPGHHSTVITSWVAHRNKWSGHIAWVAVDTHTVSASLTYVAIGKVFHVSAAETTLSGGHFVVSYV
jgi:hypothetical protein